MNGKLAVLGVPGRDGVAELTARGIRRVMDNLDQVEILVAR